MRAGRTPIAGKVTRYEPHYRRARITLPLPTRNAKSNYEYYGNGDRAGVEMMREHARSATNRATARFRSPTYQRRDRRLDDV